MHTEAVEQFDGFLAHGAVIELGQEPEHLGLAFASQEDVFRDVQRIDQAQSLVQAADTRRVGIAGRIELDSLAFELDVSLIGRLCPGEGPLPSVDLPAPLSPTSARISPGWTSKLT